jgi:IPT/TIG domain
MFSTTGGFARLAKSRAAQLGTLSALAVAGTVALVPGTASAATAAYTLSPATGPQTAGTVIAVTGTGFTTVSGTPLVKTSTNGVQFNSATSCPSAPAATAAGSVYNATKVAVVSATRMVVTADAMALGTGSAPKAYLLCAYGTATGNPLLGSAKYTVYPKPTVTRVTPSTGAVMGGATVTVEGTGFTAKTTATIGGAAMAIKVATDGRSFTATVPAHAAGNANIVVTSEGGKSTDAVPYNYINAVTVSPQLADPTNGTTITVKGVGFGDLDFATADTAEVIFTQGAYDPATEGHGGSGTEAKTCTDVQIVSDTELVCTTPALTSGAYTVGVVDDFDSAATPAFTTAISAGSTLTAAAF